MQFKEQGFFAMPENLGMIDVWIARHSPEQRVHLLALQGMYHNLICKGLAHASSIEVELQDGTKATFKRES